MTPTETDRIPSADEGSRYRGVRKRKWGKWVSEIRLPHSRDRIWLGSYDAPEKAARAFDAAMLYLRGRKAGRFNFPSDLPDIAEGRPLSHPEIQAAAARFAHAAPSSAPAPSTQGPLPCPRLVPASPDESTASDGTLTGESGDTAEMDWSFVDLLGQGGPDFAGRLDMIDDFPGGFFPAPAPAEGGVDFAEENGAAAYGQSSFLWDFW
uniref:Ethylene-responsive transcription factor ERF018 n=1 Tax=Anthurium amnicola TaxID=1678845 RepID=A0A1D1YNL1_9ARAE